MRLEPLRFISTQSNVFFFIDCNLMRRVNRYWRVARRRVDGIAQWDLLKVHDMFEIPAYNYGPFQDCRHSHMESVHH